MTAPSSKRRFDWEAAARHVGEQMDHYHAVVVVGADPTVTGTVAVALARPQALRRRVAVGDLFAESPPIQALVVGDDPHGLVDSFLYGVSLSRIAQQVPEAGQLYVMPSGSEPPPYEEILPNPRWERLAAGFREVGALLVLAVPASAPHLEDLVAATDGAVLVGDAMPERLPVSQVITAVREPRAAAPAQASESAPSAATRWTRLHIASVAGLLLAVLIGALAGWLAYRPLAGSRLPAARTGRRTMPFPRALPAVASTDSTTKPAGADSLPRDTVPTQPRPAANPGDSSIAAAYAVEVMAANTQAGAILKLQQDGKDLPAATFAPVLVQGSQWFKVICGAFTTRADAETLLVGLRRRKVLEPRTGGVVRLPFAFFIDSVPVAAVTGMVATYTERGQPVYALRQTDGKAWLLAGAFESPEQSLLYARSLRASGIEPVLVYRKGRPF